MSGARFGGRLLRYHRLDCIGHDPILIGEAPERRTLVCINGQTRDQIAFGGIRDQLFYPVFQVFHGGAGNTCRTFGALIQVKRFAAEPDLFRGTMHRRGAVGRARQIALVN
jgi:hypothetical protein